MDASDSLDLTVSDAPAGLTGPSRLSRVGRPPDVPHGRGHRGHKSGCRVPWKRRGPAPAAKNYDTLAVQSERLGEPSALTERTAGHRVRGRPGGALCVSVLRGRGVPEADQVAVGCVRDDFVAIGLAVLTLRHRGVVAEHQSTMDRVANRADPGALPASDPHPPVHGVVLEREVRVRVEGRPGAATA